MIGRGAKGSGREGERDCERWEASGGPRWGSKLDKKVKKEGQVRLFAGGRRGGDGV